MANNDCKSALQKLKDIVKEAKGRTDTIQYYGPTSFRKENLPSPLQFLENYLDNLKDTSFHNCQYDSLQKKAGFCDLRNKETMEQYSVWVDSNEIGAYWWPWQGDHNRLQVFTYNKDSWKSWNCVDD